MFVFDIRKYKKRDNTCKRCYPNLENRQQTKHYNFEIKFFCGFAAVNINIGIFGNSYFYLTFVRFTFTFISILAYSIFPLQLP